MRTSLAFASLGMGVSASVIAPPIGSRSEEPFFKFTLQAHGEASGPIGQLSDGQNRIGGSLPLGNFTLRPGPNGGEIMDQDHRGCILTPPTSQFQCDQGARPTPGFSIGCGGQLLYKGSPQFHACPVDDHGVWNLYNKPAFGQKKCITITLIANGAFGPQPSCKPSGPPIAPSRPALPSPVPCSGNQSEGCKHLSKPPFPPFPLSRPSLSLSSSPPSLSSSPSSLSSSPPSLLSHPSLPARPSLQFPSSLSPSPTSLPSRPSLPSPPSLPTSPCKHKCTEDDCGCSFQAPPVPSTSGCGLRPQGGCNATHSKPHSPNVISITPQKPSVSTSPATQSEVAHPPDLPGCPADLEGPFEFPHLIVPIDEFTPDRAIGNKLNATISDHQCTVFNFDIHPRLAGKTCSLLFLFPEQKDLQTSAYTFEAASNDPTLFAFGLPKQANYNTTWSNVGKRQAIAAGPIHPGTSVSARTIPCPAGQQKSIMLCGEGLYLEYFQDFNPKPIGLYIRAC